MTIPPATASATAVAVTVHDPTGDVPFPEGDLTAAGFAQDSSGFTFAVKVVSPTDPETDPAWLDGLVFVGWALDTNNDDEPDAIVFVGTDFDGGLSAILITPSSSQPCEGIASFVPGQGYKATFPNKCLAAGLAFRMQAAMSYTTDPEDLEPPTDIAPDNGWSPVVVTTGVTGPSGYWMLGADGRVYAFGGAAGFPGAVPGTIAMAPRRDGKGYWLTDRNGHVAARGTASSYGGSPALTRGERITSIAATATGKGYWLVSNTGRAFTYGDAHSYGDMTGTRLKGAIVAASATSSGLGYYMLGSDGGIFAFGDPRFHGSTGGMKLNKPIVGMATTKGGYWLVGSDGGVFAFDAPFRGSMGGRPLNRPIEGLVAYGNGYLMGTSDGGVFNFSNRAFVGSLANNPPTAPIIGLAAFGS